MSLSDAKDVETSFQAYSASLEQSVQASKQRLDALKKISELNLLGLDALEDNVRKLKPSLDSLDPSAFARSQAVDKDSLRLLDVVWVTNQYVLSVVDSSLTSVGGEVYTSAKTRTVGVLSAIASRAQQSVFAAFFSFKLQVEGSVTGMLVPQGVPAVLVQKVVLVAVAIPVAGFVWIFAMLTKSALSLVCGCC